MFCLSSTANTANLVSWSWSLQYLEQRNPKKYLNKCHPGEGSGAQKYCYAHCCVLCSSLLAACLITGREPNSELTRFMSSAMLGQQGPVHSLFLPNSLARRAECRWNGKAHLGAWASCICSLTEPYLSFCWYFPKQKAGRLSTADFT